MAPRKQGHRPKEKAREKQMGRPKQKARAKPKDRLSKEARAQRPARSQDKLTDRQMQKKVDDGIKRLVKRSVKRKCPSRSGTAPTATISLWRMRALEAERNVIDLLGEIKQKDERLEEVMARCKMLETQSLMLNDQLAIERFAYIRTLENKMRQNQALEDDVEQKKLGSNDVF